jgi:hypothetical protein
VDDRSGDPTRGWMGEKMIAVVIVIGIIAVIVLSVIGSRNNPTW